MRIGASLTPKSFPEYRTVVLLVAVILMAGIALPWLAINLEKFLSEGGLGSGRSQISIH